MRLVARIGAGLERALAAGAATANHSSAELAAGGLVMTRDVANELRSEVLHVSAKPNRVHYRFVNTSARDAATGANSKSPNGDLAKAVDKGDPANPVSFCGEGVRRTGPTTFDVRRTHFMPRRDVSLLILKRLEP